MQAFLHRAFIPGAVKLCNDDGSTGGKPGKKSDYQIHDLSRGAAHAGEGALSDKMTYYDRIDRIV